MLIYRNSFQYISKRNRGYLLRGHIHGIYPSIRFSRFTEGSSPSHFPFAEFFPIFPPFFKNIFSALQKAKKRPSHLSVRRSERKNKTR